MAPPERGPPGEGAVDYALVLGSNAAPARGLRLAGRRIAERFDVIACTPAMRTRDEAGGRYLNAAMRIRTALAFDALRAALHAIEDEAGRVRGSARVALDIDIVAAQDARGALLVFKPGDVARGFVRALLARVGFVPVVAQGTGEAFAPQSKNPRGSDLGRE